MWTRHIILYDINSRENIAFDLDNWDEDTDALQVAKEAGDRVKYLPKLDPDDYFEWKDRVVNLLSQLF